MNRWKFNIYEVNFLKKNTYNPLSLKLMLVSCFFAFAFKNGFNRYYEDINQIST